MVLLNRQTKPGKIEAVADALTAGRQHYAYQLRDTTADTTLAVGLMTVRAS